MSTCKTLLKSRISNRESTYNPYNNYKQITFGNKILEKKLHPNNLIMQHYKPYNFPNKKNSRSEWLNNKIIHRSECKELDGKMFKRKIKPDKVSLIIEMKLDFNYTILKEKSRNIKSNPKEFNTQRTIIPEKNV